MAPAHWRLLDEHVLAVRRWAEWAAALVKTWPEDVSRAKPPLDDARDMARHFELELGRG